MNTEPNTTIIRAYVAGPMFDDHPKAIRSLRLGDPIQMVRNPDNKVDRNAIRLTTVDGAMIGYIPRQLAAWLAPFIDAHRANMLAEVIDLHTDVITRTLRAEVAFSVPEIWIEMSDDASISRDGKIEYHVEESNNSLYVLANCDGERVELIRDIFKGNDIEVLRLGFTTWEATNGRKYDWYFKLERTPDRTVEFMQQLLKRRLKGYIKEAPANTFMHMQQEIRKELQVLREHYATAQDELKLLSSVAGSELQDADAKVAELSRQIDIKTKQADELSNQKFELEHKLKSSEWERKAKFDREEARPVISQALRDTLETHIAPALNVTQVLQLLSTLAENNFVVLDSAWKSAEAASKFRHSKKLFDLLYRLAFDYRAQMRRPYDHLAIKSLFGNDYAERESGKCQETPACLRARTFTYKGADCVMLRHLKIGVGISVVDCLRIHFHWDHEESKVVVGHCGEHLPLA